MGTLRCCVLLRSDGTFTSPEARLGKGLWSCNMTSRGISLTVSGVSPGATLCPSKRKRTLPGVFPLRSQNASMSFLSAVVRLILKNTSLLLSVTFMFRCSVGAAGGSSGFGDPPSSDMFGKCLVMRVQWMVMTELEKQRSASETIVERFLQSREVDQHTWCKVYSQSGISELD